PVAMVWPCPLPVDAYAALGRRAGVPRPAGPSCAGALVFWSGDRRYVRGAGRCGGVFVPRGRCGRGRGRQPPVAGVGPAWGVGGAEVIGGVVAEVAGGRCGVRPAAERAGVPYTTARGWVRRFVARAPQLGAGFAALAVELGGPALTSPGRPGRFALAAIGAAFAAAAALPGWAALGGWRFASSVSGGAPGRPHTTPPPVVIRRPRFL